MPTIYENQTTPAAPVCRGERLRTVFHGITAVAELKVLNYGNARRESAAHENGVGSRAELAERIPGKSLRSRFADFGGVHE
jgi:hypothetical protein